MRRMWNVCETYVKRMRYGFGTGNRSGFRDKDDPDVKELLKSGLDK